MHPTTDTRQHIPAPSRPPDGVDTHKKKCSFRDKLLGNQEPAPRRETVDLIGQKLFRIEFEDGDRRRPRCYADDSVLKELWVPWQHAIIVKLLGKNLGFFAMRDRLKALWKLTADMDIMDIGHGFFMIKFDLEADREKVINGGPWMILDHYVAIRPWTTDFISSQVKINKTLVWIRFPSLGMEYYDESLLLALATTVGSPVKVDIHTLDASRGRFARVCIEIELDKPVVGKVWFRDHWYHVEYEGLHMLCKCCGIYGHVARNCPTSNIRSNNQPKVAKDKADANVEKDAPEKTSSAATPTNDKANKESPDADAECKGEELYGDWLVVNRKKNQGRKSGAKNQGTALKPIGGDNKKLNDKELSFSHLYEAGKTLEYELENLNTGPQFHPGGGVESTKVWTKKNKRARGMTSKPKEPNNNILASQPNKSIGNQPRHKSLQLERQVRVGLLTQPIIFNGTMQTGSNERKKMDFGNLQDNSERSKQGDEHLKPPEPNEVLQQQEHGISGIDDEMVMVTPLSR